MSPHVFWGGGTPLFPWSTHPSQHRPMAVGPSHCPCTPWPSVVSSQGVAPACSEPSLPSPAPHHCPLPTPHLGFRGSPCSHSWGTLVVCLLPLQKAGSQSPQTDGAQGSLCHGQALGTALGSAGADDIVPCATLPVQCSDNGDTRLEGTWPFPLGCTAVPGAGDL